MDAVEPGRTSTQTTKQPRTPRCFAANGALTAMCSALQDDGVIYLEDVIDRTTVERINTELDPVLAGPTLGRTDAKIVSDGRRINSALRHSPTLANEVAAHSLLIDLADSVLLEHCDTLQISATQVAEIGPGEPAQLLHRDDYTWGHVKGRSHPLSFVLIMALSEFTPEVGATRSIPGSHEWDDVYQASAKSPNWKDGVYAEKSYPPGLHEELAVASTLAPGSALAMLGTTVHGAGANTSVDVYRRGLVLQYCVGWIRTAHSNFLLYPPDIAKTLPDAVQRLLGYQLEAKHCGQLEQGIDPIELLRN
jgi:ectoine hydroxylase-related dioxygenase (phytanoyl-CoA dioxygenase family)